MSNSMRYYSLETVPEEGENEGEGGREGEREEGWRNEEMRNRLFFSRKNRHFIDVLNLKSNLVAFRLNWLPPNFFAQITADSCRPRGITNCYFLLLSGKTVNFCPEFLFTCFNFKAVTSRPNSFNDSSKISRRTKIASGLPPYAFSKLQW